MSKLRATCVAAVALLSTAVLAAPAAAAPSRTGAQARGLAPVSVSGATRLGALRAQPIEVTVALAPRNRAALDALVAHPHAPLSPARFDARFAPSRATVAAVRRWARANRLRVVSVSTNRMLVRLAGSSSRFARAFRTSFVRLRLSNGVTGRTVTRTARLPRAFASHTNAVLGLTELGGFGVPRPAPRTALHTHGRSLLPPILQGAAIPSLPSSLTYPADYGPQDFWSLYDAPSSQTGSGQTLAVIAEGDLSQPQKDLATFEKQFGLPTVTWTTVQVGAASTDTSGDDEWDLDTQYSTGFAPGVTSLRVYDAASMNNSDIAAAINRWVTDDATKQASFSAGECELLAWVSGFTTTLDATLEQADAQGQTLFTSSGDTGSFCPAIVGVNGVPAGIPGPNYPASSPYAIGVGGTSVLGPGPTEASWYGTGGGASAVESAPSWQQNAGGSFAGVERGVPDVALDADPESGYRVIVSGQEQIIGGTSASAPSWQGIWARAEGAHGGSLGFAGPLLYGEPAAFHDILLGVNGLYPTTPGWDYNTGLGTADIAKIVSGA